jgi:cardiolipin synthase
MNTAWWHRLSAPTVLAVINAAARTLAVENEEMDNPAVTGALAAAARRGVDVTLTMTADTQWDGAFSELARAGVHVRLYPNDSAALYIHAKAIVADAGLAGQQALVGSQNFSIASLGYNRELGICTASPR